MSEEQPSLSAEQATPLTDAFMHSLFQVGYTETQVAKFARELERKLAAAIAHNEKLRWALDRAIDHIDCDDCDGVLVRGREGRCRKCWAIVESIRRTALAQEQEK